jgi:dipeptidyl-peptidase-4
LRSSHRIEDGKLSKWSYETGDKVADIAEEFEKEITEASFSADESKVLLGFDETEINRYSTASRYVVYDVATKTSTPVNENPIRIPVFSPDSAKVAYVFDLNLFIFDIAAGSTTQVTTDGEACKIRNGVPDWVYEEEFETLRSFEWSADSTKLAFVRLDESGVPEWSLNFYEGGPHPRVERYKYPKVGDPNAIASVHVFDVATGATRKVTEVGEDPEQYLPYIRWAGDGSLLVWRMPRRQDKFEILAVKDGEVRVAYEEHDEKGLFHLWAPTNFVWLPGSDRFVAVSQRTGFFHLYLHSISSGLIRPLTSGEWEVDKLAGAGSGFVYFTSTQASVRDRDVARVSLDGGEVELLTRSGGTWIVRPSEDCRFFVGIFHSWSQPPRTAVYRGDWSEVRVLEPNDALKAKADACPQKTAIEIVIDENTFLGYEQRPADFDPAKKYPVVIEQYSGIAGADGQHSWSWDTWLNTLVKHGVIVMNVGVRGGAGRGKAWRQVTYGCLGQLETADLLAVTAKISEFPYVDASRIGIYGWSYGGFMVLNCLTMSKLFKVGLCVAPVTSWRFYDTIYTEGLNGLLSENEAGYEWAPLAHAKDLSGKLLLMHGDADDNVHVQNTLEFVRQTQRANIEVDVEIFPNQAHALMPVRPRVFFRLTKFALDNL